jgi:DNA-3-methyladenine glycosylase
MFGPPGTLYLFVSYGVHLLLNLVCLPEGRGAAVLVRALEPVGDTSVLLANRGLSVDDLRVSTSGPGRVGSALGLHFDLNNLRLGEASGVHVIDDGLQCPVDATGRIGISAGRELPLRYILPGNPFVSRAPRLGARVRDPGRREQVDETR